MRKAARLSSALRPGAGARSRQPPARATFPLAAIWSGGQTGADRAALDFARARGFATGGWCPRGRRAEDGVIPPEYPLTETTSEDYEERTRLNVRDCDATVIFSLASELSGGSRYTLACARALGKPVLHLCAAEGVRAAAARLRAFLQRHRVRRLNVAGPRASQEPGVGAWVTAVLEAAWPREQPARSPRRTS